MTGGVGRSLRPPVRSGMDTAKVAPRKGPSGGAAGPTLQEAGSPGVCAGPHASAGLHGAARGVRLSRSRLDQNTPIVEPSRAFLRVRRPPLPRQPGPGSVPGTPSLRQLSPPGQLLSYLSADPLLRLSQPRIHNLINTCLPS